MRLIQNLALLSLAVAISSLIVSCEKVKDPYNGILVSACDRVPNAISIWGDTGNVTVKKMIIEEITGHTCGSCPAKTELIIDWVDNEYKNKVYSVAYHAGGFAVPFVDYPTDFRTAKGTAFNEKYGDGTAPMAIFNRTDLNGSGLAVSGNQFSNEFEKLVSNGGLEKPNIQLKLHNQYDEENNTNKISVTGKALEALEGDLSVIIYVTEDRIISDQKDNRLPVPEWHIKEFEHRHVFRGAVGPLDGNTFVTGGLATGSEVKKCFDFVLKDKWNKLNCHFIVAIKSVQTGEIIQVDEVHATVNQ